MLLATTEDTTDMVSYTVDVNVGMSAAAATAPSESVRVAPEKRMFAVEDLSG